MPALKQLKGMIVMLKKIAITAILISSVCLAAGCSAKVETRSQKLPPAGLRIAVLPFASVDKDGKYFESEPSFSISDLGVPAEKEKLSPEEVTRRAVQAQLSETPFQLLSPALIDVDLPHRKAFFKDGKLDLNQLHVTPASIICTKVFDCDAVLYGRIHEWDQSYYGLESVNSVDLSVTIRSAKSDKELYYSRVSDSEGSGISQGPTGYFSLAVEPVKALDSEKIESLMLSSVEKLMEPLEAMRRIPGNNETPPAIFASGQNTQQGIINRDHGLKVLVFGTENSDGWFAITGVTRRVPLHEASNGRYIGKFFPLERENFERRPVKAFLSDEYGRITSQQVSGGAVSLK